MLDFLLQVPMYIHDPPQQWAMMSMPDNKGENNGWG
jgi:hypothetical protein